MSVFWYDLRYAVRALRRRPGFTAVAVATLALGIGANTSVFTLLNATLFRPAPAAEPDRLVWIAPTAGRSRRIENASYPDYLRYRDRAGGVFSGVIAFSGVPISLGGSAPERVNGLVVSGNYFDVLGIRAALGRTFAPEEDREPGAHPVAVLSDALWTRRFGSDPSVVGRVVTIDGRAFTVIGVAPRGFGGVELDDPIELWVPLAMLEAVLPTQPGLLKSPDSRWLRLIARLNDGVSLEEANAAAAVLAVRQSGSPATGAERETGVTVMPVLGGLDPRNRTEAIPVFALLSVVPILVLLVACANAANVLLARALGRHPELSLRQAVGASRARLVRQLLVEALLIAVIAGGVGVILSFYLTAAIGRLGAVPSFLLDAMTPDGRVLLATLAVALLTGIVFGLAPALAATRVDVQRGLKGEALAVRVGGRRHRLRDVLMVGQVATSLVLVVTAGLFLQSLRKALRVDPGFEVRRGVSLSFDLVLQGYSPEAQTVFHRRVVEGARALRGVESAALISDPPLSGRMTGTEVQQEGAASEARGLSVGLASTSPGYFHTMGIGLDRGRDFTIGDNASAPPVVIVNETMARLLWPGVPPLGRRLRMLDRGEPLREVVGVVRNGKYAALTERSRPFLYLPVSQQRFSSQMALVVRTAADSKAVTPNLVKMVRSLDPDLPVFKVVTFEQMLALAADKQRAASALLGVFGFLALSLAGLGLYGATANHVTVRTREIGLRISLGASRSDVLRLFVGEGMVLVLAGVGLGLLVSAAWSRLLAGFLFGLSATDGVTFVAGTGILIAAAVLASYLPARRAARVDPMVALRYE